MTDEGSKLEILPRIAQTINALSKLKTMWKDNIVLSSKIRLMRSLVISNFLCACETCAFIAELERTIQTTDMRCFRRLLGISYTVHVTTEEVKNIIMYAIGPYENSKFCAWVHTSTRQDSPWADKVDCKPAVNCKAG